jgi:hypothetical protein
MYRIILLSFIILTACTSQAPDDAGISTEEDRLALFDYIYEKTLEREAFSPVKERTLGVDVREEMMKCKDDFRNASTEAEFFFALKKMSCARRDRHLDIELVDGGIELPEMEEGVAPIRFLPDYSVDGISVYVSDITNDFQSYVPENVEVTLGDKVLEVNGKSLPQYFDEASIYIRYSTVNNLKRTFTTMLSEKEKELLPRSFYGDELSLNLEKEDGSTYTVQLPYLNPDDLQFVQAAKHKYAGYTKAFERQTYHLYLPDDPGNRTLVLWWYGFREDLVDDMDHLVEYADENDLLDYDLIIDLTDSRGGSRGAYAVQRLSSKPFKTTFGNLKLSDMAADFVESREAAYAERQDFMDGTEKETDDDGTWLINWLREDVVPRMEAGEEYSSNVPFKCAHAPHTSDGILYPAEKHFTGQLICLFGPKGGSHLDQFSSIVNDNDLGYTIGMPGGGYSNTWEGDEVLQFPISGQPVVEYMWSLGHTIRPNGEILEGNPAQVDEYIPLTRQNFRDYVPQLLEVAQKKLAEQS